MNSNVWRKFQRLIGKKGSEEDAFVSEPEKDMKETNSMSSADAEKRQRDFAIFASVQTDPGCVRDANEDAGRHFQPQDPSLLDRRGALTIVADGMGGHAAGEVASRIAVETVGRIYYEADGAPQEALRRAFCEANLRIYETSLADQSMRGMGTTCTALALCDGRAFIAHVGDSRAYLLRAGRLNLLTEDHSAVMEMVRQGIISREEARHHADKNVITRALGTTPEVEVSLLDPPLKVRVGDLFLLCSDGLYDLVEESEIERILLAARNPHDAGEKLIATARARGGHDNITVGIVVLRATEELQPTPITREVEAI